MESKKRKPGRPRKPVDEKLLRGLARIHCTQNEMALLLGVSVDTLQNNYSAIIHEGMADGKMSVRRAQLKAAERGNTGMLIWLGKILLGQKETISVSSAEPEVRALLRKWGADMVANAPSESKSIEKIA